MQRTRIWIAGLVLAAGSPAGAATLEDLVRAYPEALDRIEGGQLVWRDGTQMAVDDGLGPKSAAVWLASPDIKDMVRHAYPTGAPVAPPAPDFDPGRARNSAFFDKLYGDCRKGEVVANLVKVAWLPNNGGKPVMFNGRQGAARRLAAISARLDALPAAFGVYLVPSAGTYNCRVIAGTDRLSGHGYGIAIDIAVAHAHYWRWAKRTPSGARIYANKIPLEIVAAFEAEGFIWGGRWSHFDTMHFEYRPEFTAPRQP